jgi:hypothetical protein
MVISLLDVSSFAVNTFNKNAITKAKLRGFGLEVDDYLWTYTADEISKNM